MTTTSVRTVPATRAARFAPRPRLLPGLAVDLDQDAAAVTRVRQPAREPLALEPVDQPRHRGGRQAGVPGQLPRGQRPQAVQQVDGLLLGGAEPAPLGQGAVVHHRRRALGAARRLQLPEQLGPSTVSACHARHCTVYFV